ncbi:MAG TPA: helix-turn-helix transcriptional regulator [Firmicutes bacterium]|nr:helix-turn-helix transcriptional regulator [Bacillota bacterium]
MVTDGDHVRQETRELREKHGWSQQQLADRIGTARVTITMYEAGEREPDFDTLTSIAQALGVTTDYLLGRSDDPHPPAAAQAEEEEPWPEGISVLRRASSKLTPERKRLIISLIKTVLEEEEREEKQGETGGTTKGGQGQPGPKGGPRGPA